MNSKKKGQIKSRKSRRKVWGEFKRSWELYVLALPAIVLLFLFAYMPMGGLLISFKDYNFKKGILGSNWMNPWYKNFEILFKNNDAAFRAIRNTLCLNLLFIAVGTVFAIALALSLNEIRNKRLKKVTQSLSFLPYFISTVVVGIFVSGMLGYENGTVNKLITSLGGNKIEFYMRPGMWPFILLAVNIWKGAGYSAIIYIAAISGFDSSYYEAAEIDGATRWQQTWYISLGLLKPTIIIMTLLSVGKIMNADFGLFYNIIGKNPALYPVTDVVDTYIYRALRELGDLGISAATGFFQSVVSFILILTCNKLANKYEEGSGLF